MDKESPCWKSTNGTLPPCAGGTTALEKALRGYANEKTPTVIVHVVGSTFDSLGEAYDFYNLYLWEKGFGIRYSKSRLNVERTKCMQEIVCGCSGVPKRSNTRTCRCRCPAMIRLLRTNDNGWYISEHRASHNHSLTENCSEKLYWPSHRHIDIYTRDVVKQLRENNISIGKVYNIIGSFFSAMSNVPFSKRALRGLCGQISREQVDDDVRKTMEVFAELGAKDSGLYYRVQPDEDNRIRNLLWSTGASRSQYHFFGDAITFDTTYRTNM
uniref:FAR1 domain-containing protein n=1 Tax=Aegilops tauschii subsp. strangulata TaxID=200361 RepID=A0A453J492_AEGTS